jgi:hypothetical protein
MPFRQPWPLTPRPSVPPGGVILRGERPGGGKTDFAWPGERSKKATEERCREAIKLKRAELAISSHAKMIVGPWFVDEHGCMSRYLVGAPLDAKGKTEKIIARCVADFEARE